MGTSEESKPNTRDQTLKRLPTIPPWQATRKELRQVGRHAELSGNLHWRLLTQARQASQRAESGHGHDGSGNAHDRRLHEGSFSRITDFNSSVILPNTTTLRHDPALARPRHGAS